MWCTSLLSAMREWLCGCMWGSNPATTLCSAGIEPGLWRDYIITLYLTKSNSSCPPCNKHCLTDARVEGDILSVAWLQMGGEMSLLFCNQSIWKFCQVWCTTPSLNNLNNLIVVKVGSEGKEIFHRPLPQQVLWHLALPFQVIRAPLVIPSTALAVSAAYLWLPLAVFDVVL